MLYENETAKAGTTWYVDTGGTDKNDKGTSDEPFKTIEYALGNFDLENGDKILIEKGTYRICEPLIIEKYGLTIQGESGESIKIEMGEGCDSTYDGTAFLIDNDIIETNNDDDELDLTFKDLEISDFRFGIRTEEQTISANGLISMIEIKNVTFDNIGKDDISVGSCDIGETTIISPYRKSTGLTDSILASTTLGGIIFTSTDQGLGGENIQIKVVDGVACDIENNTDCAKFTGSVVTVKVDLDDADGVTSEDTNAVTWAMIAADIIDEGSTLLDVDSTSASGNASATTTNLSIGDGAAIFLQNLSDITISNSGDDPAMENVTHGIYIEDKNGQELSDISISNITMQDMDHTGITIVGDTNGDNNSISGIDIDGISGCGMSFQTTQDWKVSNIVIDDPGKDGIYLETMENSSFDDITISEPTDIGIDATGLVEVDFDNINIDKPGSYGIVINGSDNSDTTLNNITINKAGDIGLSITNADGGKISNSNISESDEMGILMSDSEDFDIFSNTVYNNSKEGIKIEGKGNDEGSMYDNLIYDNGEAGVFFDGSTEDTKFYSNTLYNNEGNDDKQVQDESDEDDGIKMYYENAESPYKQGSYYGMFSGKDTNFDGIADDGYLPDEQDDDDGHRDIYATLSSARVDTNMSTTISYTTFNVPYTVINEGKGLKTVKACIRESGTTAVYVCTTDSNTTSPVNAVTGIAGKTYDLIIVAGDIYSNKEKDPATTDTAELVVVLSSSASGTEPVTEEPTTPTDPVTPTEPIDVNATTPPNKVSDVLAVSASTNEILLTWSGNNPDEAVTTYSIYKSSDNSSFSKVATIESSTTQYISSNLSSGTTYYYKIKATNSKGDSPDSSTVSGKSGNPTINEYATSNIIRSIATTKTVARSTDTKAYLEANPTVINEATNNNSHSIVTHIEGNDSSNVAAVYPLYDSRYQFISPKTYKMSVTNISNDVEQSTFDNYFTVEIHYSNDDVTHISEDNLTIGVYNDISKTWVPLFNTVDSNANVVRAKTRQLGYFAILAHTAPRAYNDVYSNSSFIGYIGNLTRSGVVSGNGSEFKGDSNASRAELMKMKVRAEGYSLPSYISSNPCPDVGKDEWFAPYFKVALDKGIIGGYPDGTCKPFNHVTRAEATKIILGKDGESYTGGLSFSDYASIPTWARSYIAYAQTNGILGGYPDGTFRADNKITRNEISKILYEYMSRTY
jgi:hypothetical protein